MSAGGQTTRSRDIPAVRRVAIHDAAHMPQDYSTTPGGTLFSTTPGDSNFRYVHSNQNLQQLKNRFMSRYTEPTEAAEQNKDGRRMC